MERKKTFGLLSDKVIDTKGEELEKFLQKEKVEKVHIPADTRSAFPVISVHSPVSIQCRWQS